ncbi:hypothetical protein MQC88_07055 [Luteimonas sp. 50]|uniref:Tetratricopeptide repeat protein n=1 Tax=Cognatiluteimonas sedimenti TaxID=2927791 RepID=A0ABT0A447_9GAMM|nr:hypothetical protein [Lysobacter sedimenti]MCJ0825713.1 hypothetical protein [Lysobacter sedimenti]
MPSGKRAVWLVIGLCLLPFLPGIAGPFMLDDNVNLQPVLSALQDGDWWRAISGNASGPFGRPLAMASFAANAMVSGEFPLGYKLVNVLIHGCNGLLVFALASQLYPAMARATMPTQARGVALLATALWLLHPLQVGSVLYVVQRMTLLATTGMLLSLLVTARFLGGNDFGPRRSARTLALVVLCSVLGLLAKEITVLVPVLIGLLAAFIPAPDGAQARRSRRVFVLLAAVLPAALYALLLLVNWDVVIASYQRRDFTLPQRLATEPVILLHYLGAMLWPDIRQMGLHLDYPLHQPGDAASLAATGFWLLAAVTAWIGRRRFPLAAFAILWFLGCHLLESTVFGLELAFEHRNYLALFGVALWAAGCAWSVCSARPRAFPWLACIVAAMLGACTLQRAREWSDEGRFLRLEAQRHPQSFRALNNLGEYHFRHGDEKGMASSTALLASRFPDNFFAQSQKLILVACRLLPGPPDWPELRRVALLHPEDPWSSSALVSIADNTNPYPCNGIGRGQLEEFLDDLAAEYGRRGLAGGAGDALLAKARLQRNFSDESGYEALLAEAVAADAARNDAALELLGAYLARGESAKADALATQLEPRLREGDETRRFRQLMARYRDRPN